VVSGTQYEIAPGVAGTSWYETAPDGAVARVVADAWVKKYPVYAGGTVGGGCMTAVGNCLTLAGGG